MKNIPSLFSLLIILSLTLVQNVLAADSSAVKQGYTKQQADAIIAQVQKANQCYSRAGRNVHLETLRLLNRALPSGYVNSRDITSISRERLFRSNKNFEPEKYSYAKTHQILDEVLERAEIRQEKHRVKEILLRSLDSLPQRMAGLCQEKLTNPEAKALWESGTQVRTYVWQQYVQKVKEYVQKR